MVPADGSARAAAPIGADFEAVMNGLRANDRVGFCRSARVRKWPNPEAHEAAANFRLSRYSGPIWRARQASALMGANCEIAHRRPGQAC
jgi:hypothetical protein